MFYARDERMSFLPRRLRTSLRSTAPTEQIVPDAMALSMGEAIEHLDELAEAEEESSRVGRSSSTSSTARTGARKGQWAKGTGFGGNWCCPELHLLFVGAKQRAVKAQTLHDASLEAVARALARTIRKEAAGEDLLTKLRQSKLRASLQR